MNVGRLGHENILYLLHNKLADAGFSSFGEPANKYGSQPGHPFVMRAGQLHIALRVLEGLVAQPFLQHGNRNAAEDAVTAVGVPEGVGVGPGRVDAYLQGRLFHNLAQTPPGDVQHRPLPVLVVE